ncbi:MAG: radical SAM protein [Candidatus Marithrix sp.]
MSKKPLAIVRVPYLSMYNLLDVREEPIVSSLTEYLFSVGANFEVFDFHLDRTLDTNTLVKFRADIYIICIRGTGLHWKYALKISQHILLKTKARIIFYGQTGKLQHWKNPDSERITTILHNEQAIGVELGLPRKGLSFGVDLTHYPYGLKYFDSLGARKNLFKATIETTRGCHFGCKFCFINHGKNYISRFTRQPVDNVIRDIQKYLEKGVNKFWFYDSEFIGGDKSHYPEVTELLTQLRDRFYGEIEIMIYNRADTLENFGNYKLLADAGIKSILLGIESLDDRDLKNMQKKQTSSIALTAIKKLRDNSIFCNLSFILFNKTATIDSLQTNISKIAELYNEDNFIYLGQTIYFSYAFESDWSPSKQVKNLSRKTKLSGSTNSTVSPSMGITFDPSLEPFAEICRIINYEQVRKLCELNLGKEDAMSDIKTKIHKWATLLNLFTLNLMQVALDEFKLGRLTLETVQLYEKWVYTSYKDFNKLLLPHEIADTITDKFGDFEGDWNGWESKIPTII